MLLSLVPALKPHGNMTLQHLQTLHKLQGEQQMLALFHWCGKCQRCRWWRGVFCAFFPGSGCDLSLWWDAQHLIHKHGGRRCVLWLAWQTAEEMPSYCTRFVIIHLRAALCFEATHMTKTGKWIHVMQMNCTSLSRSSCKCIFIGWNGVFFSNFDESVGCLIFVCSWETTPSVKIFKDDVEHVLI